MARPQNTAFLREWAPLTDLFSKLPNRTGGIFSQDIKLTCIDVASEFLVLGTNVGVIFWYDRKRKDLQRLRCENASSAITFVRAVSTVDYMVASGNQSGSITIFQIPKSHPETLPDNLKPQQKQVERYTVMDLHKSPITSLEWSKNGMKLFSGDKLGSIVLTEIDFYMHVCKSIEILNESYEVVQLSYRQQYLLISTTFRSIICHHQDKWKVCQVGKKDRKVLGKFGGIIHQQGYKPSDIVLYCMRPGLRVWIADAEGEVKKTLLFKDLLCKDTAQVPLLNPISKALQHLKPQKEAAFGVMQQFCDNLLITYNNDVAYILDPDSLSVLAAVNHLRSILDIATYKDEIFILEEERSLIRISYHPECDAEDANLVVDNTIANAEEAQETLKDDTRTFDEISSQEFDDSILFKNARKTKRKTYKEDKEKQTSNQVSSIAEKENLNFTRPTLMNLSTVGVLPDLRNPETIVSDIESKERILSDMLNLDTLKLNLEESSKTLENNAKDTNNEKISFKMEVMDDVPLVNDAKEKTNFIKKQSDTITQVVRVPKDWKLSSIEISKAEPEKHQRITSPSIPIIQKEARKSSSTTTDSSLSDWEIV